MIPSPAANAPINWYERRHELCPDQVFRTVTGDLVRLERRVPGDGTQWYVADWHQGWCYCDSTIEPGDLVDLIAPDQLPALTAGT